jgi:hypothetical protein
MNIVKNQEVYVVAAVPTSRRECAVHKHYHHFLLAVLHTNRPCLYAALVAMRYCTHAASEIKRQCCSL